MNSAGMMTFAEHKRILDKVKPYALVTSLYNHGEPFLNKDVFNSGLEYLTISLDGTSQESYQQYRVRGDYKEVIENVNAVVAAPETAEEQNTVSRMAVHCVQTQ